VVSSSVNEKPKTERIPTHGNERKAENGLAVGEALSEQEEEQV